MGGGSNGCAGGGGRTERGRRGSGRITLIGVAWIGANERLEHYESGMIQNQDKSEKVQRP